MKSERKKSSIKNMITAVGSNIITIIVGLVAQAIFIKILGSEYLGLNGLFSNIISMLGIVELGIGSAIIYNMYKPIAEKDTEKIKSLMKFYKKSYNIITFIIACIGILIIPFIKYIVDIKSVTADINVYIVYLLFLSETICSYILSYKRSILYADQKEYITNITHIGYTIVVNTLQLISLYLIHNYYLYLIIKIMMRLMENIVISIIVAKKYEYLNNKNIESLDKQTEKDIFQKIKALFFHKIGTFIVSGTDNIIISKYLGLVTVGLYSNYFLIINAVQTVLNHFVSATKASVGNLLVTESKKKQFEIFDKIRFMNFWLSCFSSICIFVIMDSFITIWIGYKFVLPTKVLLVLVINFFIVSSRSAYGAFKEAAGIFYEDRFIPIIESLLNIVLSIIFVKKFGLMGVFMGTVASGLVLWCYSYPKYVYKNLFGRSYYDYIKETIYYLIVFVLIAGFSYSLAILISFENIYLQFISNVLIALIVPNVIMLLLFSKDENFKYFINMLKGFKK